MTNYFFKNIIILFDERLTLNFVGCSSVPGSSLQEENRQKENFLTIFKLFFILLKNNYYTRMKDSLIRDVL